MRQVVTKNTGFARNGSEAEYPNLWRGLTLAWCPALNARGGGKLSDITGRGGDGTLTLMDEATDWVLVNGQAGLDFDGANDYVTSNMTVAGYNQMTIAAWMIGTNAAAGCGGTFNNRVHILLYGDGSAGYFSVENGSPNAPNCTITAAEYGTWVHICMVFDGTKSTDGEKLVVYVNGTPRTLAGNTGLPSSIASPSSFELGRDSNAGTPRYWAGKNGTTLCYNRPLSDSEIARLYALGQTGFALPRKRTRIVPEQAAAPAVANPALFHAHYMSQGMRP